ncbi:MAG TPA: hypothetical protein VLN90_04270, partial [Thioalkalivibrio sp.]|nr:hypothetical protein [Thioalkalivibrio sp.]
MIRFLSVLLVLLSLVGPAQAGRVIDAGPEDYRQVLNRLGPGDVLRLQAGVYREGLPLRGVTGESGRPVVIEGPSE